MSDQAFGGGFGNYGNTGIDDDVILVNLDPAETSGIDIFTTCPIGTHCFQIDGLPDVSTTKDNEIMLTVKMKVVQTNVKGAMGAMHMETITIPGDTRKQNSRKSYDFMMRLLRIRLEAITGRPWRTDNLGIRRSEFPGRQVIATCYHEETTGEGGKTYTNNRLRDWNSVGAPASQQQAFGQPQQTVGQALNGLPQQQPQPTMPPMEQPQQGPPPAQGNGGVNFPSMNQPAASEEPF